MATNTGVSSGVCTSSANILSTAHEVLLGLGFNDQRPNIIAEDQLHHNTYFQLHSAIKNYQAQANPQNQFKLIKVLNQEIKRLKTEYQHLKTKKTAVQSIQPSSSGYVSQWGSWFLNSAKQFFGSDNESQAQRYVALAKARQDQIVKLKNYRDELRLKNKLKSKIVAEDVVELNTDDVSPMSRKLMTLPLTNEFLVNSDSTSQVQTNPHISVQSGGDFIISYFSNSLSGGTIRIRRFNRDGSPLSSPLSIVTVPQTTTDIGVQPNNNFIVIWAKDHGSPYDVDIEGARFDATGSPLVGGNFAINRIDDQGYPKIGILSSGDYIITWQSQNSTELLGIYAQRFNATGFAQKAEFRIDTGVLKSQTKPVIGVQPNNNFIIVWQSYTSGAYGVIGRCFNVSGSPLNTEFYVNTFSNFYLGLGTHAIGMQPNGNFVVTWANSGQDGDGFGVYARQFNATGSPLSTEFRVNTYIFLDQENPAIGIQQTGAFVIAWNSDGQDGGGDGVYAQRFNSDGTFLGLEFRINSYTVNSQIYPAIGMQPSGNFVVTWAGFGQYSGTDIDVYARIFCPLNMGNNTLTINEGQTIPLTTTILSATSGGTPSDILFTVSNVLNGQFELSSNPGVAITQFTKQQIIDGVVKFKHDGSTHSPSFSVTVTDGNETLGPFAAEINFTLAPIVSSSTGKLLSSLSSTAISAMGSVSSSSTSTNTALSSTAVNLIASSTADATLPISSTAVNLTEAEVTTSGGGLSTAAKIGIGVGGGGGAILIMGAIGFFYCRKKPSKSPSVELINNDVDEVKKIEMRIISEASQVAKTIVARKHQAQAAPKPPIAQSSEQSIDTSSVHVSIPNGASQAAPEVNIAPVAADASTLAANTLLVAANTAPAVTNALPAAESNTESSISKPTLLQPTAFTRI